MRMHPFLEFGGPLAFAHRGGAAEAPENTMRAFARAISLGYLYLETDVYASADGVVLAFHDDRLDRLTGAKGTLASVNYAAIAPIRVNGAEPIPKLADILAAWPEARLNIDPKSDDVVRPLIKLLREMNCLERVCVGSFSGKRLKALRTEFGTQLCTSLGPSEVTRLKLFGRGLGAIQFDGQCAQVPTTWPVLGMQMCVVDSGFVEACHAHNLQVHVWTIDDRAEMEALLDLGVDGLMTDRPAVLKEVLEDRAQWCSP